MNSPKQIVTIWVEAFNRADLDALAELYAVDAVNHQQPNEAVCGREAIKNMFRSEFAAAPFMHCIPVQMIEEGNWCVLEWKDPKGFPGCGFFEVINGLIITQRGYWDKQSFEKIYSS
jgi:limonene-1,2-epoxide hydrolase